MVKEIDMNEIIEMAVEKMLMRLPPSTPSLMEQTTKDYRYFAKQIANKLYYDIGLDKIELAYKDVSTLIDMNEMALRDVQTSEICGSDLKATIRNADRIGKTLIDAMTNIISYLAIIRYLESLESS